MARQNVPFLAYNRGLVSPKALGRVDIDRTRLSAETFNNFICHTQGAMTIRPGTKYVGSSRHDTGAQWIEFIAATDDVALCELTNDTGSGQGSMRIWLGSDAHNLSLLTRSAVDTTVSLTDTGWDDNSTGGSVGGIGVDIIPPMTSSSGGGVTITASSQNAGYEAWKAVDDGIYTEWWDTGVDGSALPSWFNVDFDTGANGSDAKAIISYSIRSSDSSRYLDNAPSSWRLIAGNHDTGTYATDTGKWTLQDERSSETGWSLSEKRTYTTPEGDTGTVTSYRHWRLYFTALDGNTELIISEIEMFSGLSATHTSIVGSSLVLNALSIGAVAKYQKKVIVSDTGTEHSLDINVSRGPVTFRVGSTQGDDDYISETSLGTGYHNLAFTPFGDFHLTFQSTENVDRIIDSCSIGGSGTVELRTPWTASSLNNVRYDQSADVVYVAASGFQPRKIVRRGTGRSWSVVEYDPNNGPFYAASSSTAKLSVSHFYGNTTMETDSPFFTPNHVGGLIRAFHAGEGGEWALGALDAKTDVAKVVGINDTGTPKTANNERRIVFDVSGTWAGEITIERSVDGPDYGFKTRSSESGVAGNIVDTGTFTTTIDDQDDNVQVWYRARVTSYTSGVAIVKITSNSGGVTGVARITAYNNNKNVDVEVLQRFSDTGYSDNWQEGYWSDANGYPTAVALHGGRLAFANGANLFLSVSDDYENFDELTTGDAGPIIRTLGSGPVDNIYYLISLLRLIVGTSGAEVAIRSSSLDEPLTPDNSNARIFSTQGSANLRAVKLDTKAIFAQRSKQRLFMVGFGLQGDALGDYEGYELTLLVPDLLSAGIESIAIQRQPDTRIHCVLGDGTVAILTYEPQEEVICWTTWSTDGTVEKAMVLPGVSEDAVYYHINRTVNGQTKRFLEKWAKQSECFGDTGLSWLADCAVSFSDTGRSNTFDAAATHLAGSSVIAWGDLDTGSTPYIDLSPGEDTGQSLYALDTGGDLDISAYGLTHGVNQGVLGLPYTADWKSTKLAYAAQAGTALAQMKRVPKMGFLIFKTHNLGLRAGADTGHLDNLPRRINGKIVDQDKIFSAEDLYAAPFNGKWDEDSRIHLRSQAPRPCTVLAIVPTVHTNDDV